MRKMFRGRRWDCFNIFWNTLSGERAASSRDVKNAIKFNKSARKYLSGLSRARANLLGAARMVRRKMCVKPMEENEDDKVVSMIVNYFSARVNIADGYREKPRLLQTFAKSVRRVNSFKQTLVYKSIAPVVTSSLQNAYSMLFTYSISFNFRSNFETLSSRPRVII